MMTRTLIGFALSAMALTTGCSRNPATGHRELNLVSEGQEIQMGQEGAAQVDAQLGIYNDAGLNAYVNRVGQRLAAASERPNLPWTFKVVDDPAINAFALPGGPIYVTRGILATMENEAELAMVLGHEIGHVTARHSAAQMSQQQLAQLGLAVGSIVSPTVARYGQIASAGLGLLMLKYGRDDERQADGLGLRYIRRTNYDARQADDVFLVLDRQSQAAGGERVPTWLSTHPDPGNRAEWIQSEVATIPADSVGRTVNANEFMQQLDGMIYGPNPREGFFRGAQFFHPDMRFKLVFPEGWQTQNLKQGVVAVSREQDAIIQLALAQENSADAAARAFFSQQGVQGSSASRGTINGLPAVAGPFAAQTENGVINGSVAFIEHGGAVFGLLAYAPNARWSAYQSVAERTIRSFEVLSDQAALNVQPLRIDLVRIDRSTTLEALIRTRPAAVPVATLALINQVEPQTPLEAGRTVKWVVGQPVALSGAP